MAVISFHIPPHITHFPTNPPFTYPHIHFLSPIKHPNISALSSNKCGRMPRQWAIHLFPLPFLLLLIQLSLKERAKASDIVEFLFQNQRICGEPFADAQWVPVLDLCELECKADEEVCMEDDQMKQSCRKLPTECTRAFRAQQPINLHKGMVQIGKKAKEEQNQPTKLPSSTSRPMVVIAKNSAAAIAAISKGEGGVNSLMRGARRKKQSRRKLRANAGGKTRQIAKSASAAGGKNGRGETKKITVMRSRRNEKGKKPTMKGGGMRLRQRQWREIMRRRKKQNGRN